MPDKIREIPYGISDFEKIRKENQYFVDKTEYIRILERHKYIFFIRPRRFGKSLLMNMLESYYDVNKKGNYSAISYQHSANPKPAHACLLTADS